MASPINNRKYKQHATSQNILFRVLIALGSPLYGFIENIVLGVLYLFSIIIFPFKKRKRKAVNTQQEKTYSKLYIFFLYFLFILFISPLIAAFVIWKMYLQDLPSPQTLTKRDIKASTKIYDRNGILLFNIYKSENRTPISLSEIPLHVRQATLAIEDAEFYDHPGFSVRGISRALLHNYNNKGELSGGSTITQQLVKNTLLTTEKTIERKVRELALSFMVEWTFTKDEILEMYLNEVSYGGTAYGIQEAARLYFGKDVQDLSLAESSFLAGLPKSPTTYSPYGDNPQVAYDRQKKVLKLMKINGYITQKEREKAAQKLLWISPNSIDILAPHFVMYVRGELEKMYGPELVQTGGLRVLTTLDLTLQNKVQEIVSQELKDLANLNVGNGAAIVLDSRTGEILAMVGSKNYFDPNNDGNVNMTTRPRQPGSSIKTINYTYALSNGWTPASIIADTPFSILDINSNTPYTPRNYDGTFKGNLTLRNAFAQSRNIPAVRLLNEYGVDTMIAAGKELGITTWNDPRGYGLSLTLGGGEVRLIDLALVYATIANQGIKNELHSQIKVANTKKRVLYNNPCSSTTTSKKDNVCGRQILDPRVAFIVTDILKDNRARTPAFGSHSQLVIPNHPEVAVKTGTSNNLRDNLAVGYTKDYTVAVWVGNNDFTPMSRVASGLTGASSIFNKIMVEILFEKDSYEWNKPDGIVENYICPITGTLSCNGCPSVKEYFLDGNTPQTRCNPEQFIEKEIIQSEGELLPESANTEAVEGNQ